MYIVDTDILIWVLRGKQSYKNYIETLADKDTLAISTITIAEIYKNIFPAELIKTELFLSHLYTVPVTVEIAKQAGLYWQQYKKHLNNLSITDCLIASTAYTNNGVLVSLNGKHFPMKDIQVLSPIAI